MIFVRSEMFLDSKLSVSVIWAAIAHTCDMYRKNEPFTHFSIADEDIDTSTVELNQLV